MTISTNKFDGATKTISGAEVKNVKFNSIPGAYLGMVMHEGKFISFMWDKRGKSKNKAFPQYNLA
jgi:hypothetical protein